MDNIIGNHKMFLFCFFHKKKLWLSFQQHFISRCVIICIFFCLQSSSNSFWGLGLILKYIQRKNWLGEAVNRKLNVHHLLTTHADGNWDEASYFG